MGFCCLLGSFLASMVSLPQLNEGRHLKKRPTKSHVDKVLQLFDGSKVNFTKVGQEKVLFQFEASKDGDVQFFPKAPIDVENSLNVVAINVIQLNMEVEVKKTAWEAEGRREDRR